MTIDGDCVTRSPLYVQHDITIRFLISRQMSKELVVTTPCQMKWNGSQSQLSMQGKLISTRPVIHSKKTPSDSAIRYDTPESPFDVAPPHLPAEGNQFEFCKWSLMKNKRMGNQTNKQHHYTQFSIHYFQIYTTHYSQFQLKRTIN